MAALCIALKYRLVWRSLATSPWAIVGAVLALLWAMGAIVGIGAAAVSIRALAPELGAHAAVLGGAGLVVLLVGLTVVMGTTDPLAPERFSLLPVRAGRLQRGLFVASVVDIVGIATLALLGAGLIVWSAWPAALVTAIVLLPLALATCLLIARVASDLLARQLAGRRSRDIMAVLLLVVLMTLGLSISAVTAGLETVDDLPGLIAGVAATVAWTPIGAVFDVPRAVAGGAWLEAAAKLAIAVATVALCWWAWGRMLRGRLENPIAERGGGRVREGRLLDRMLPATPVGAIAARGLRYRRRDVRHLLNVIAVLLVPAMLLGLQLVQSGGEGVSELVLLLPVLMAWISTSVVQLDTAYDNSAFAAHILAGVRGADDRAGRLLAISIPVVPVLVVTSILCTALVGRWELLPASLGAGLGVYGILAGITIWVAVHLPGEAPPPGSNPFGKGSSGGAQALVGTLIASLAGAIPVLALLATAIASLWIPWLAWVVLGLGLALGGVAVWLGITRGGAALDRLAPEVLAKVSRS